MENKDPGNRKASGSKKPGTFQPGQSGNPSGRPKVPEEIKSAFREHTLEAVETLVKIMNAPGAKDADRLRAAEVILDRGWGKAAQSMEVDLNQIPQVVFVNADNIPD